MAIMNLWEQLWEAQNKRGSACNREVELKDTATRSCSFDILCQSCFDKPQIDMVIFDEFEGYPLG